MTAASEGKTLDVLFQEYEAAVECYNEATKRGCEQ